MEKYSLTGKQFEQLMGSELPIGYVAKMREVGGTMDNFEGEISRAEDKERIATFTMEKNAFGGERYVLMVELADSRLMEGLKSVNAKSIKGKHEGEKKQAVKGD
ncbi:hypothetical protein GF415_01620 [Candidatus Micrarchaeota archaeon]|nr:hypothetical protein [Candidatus Micrarchaeota archaeon]